MNGNDREMKTSKAEKVEKQKSDICKPKTKILTKHVRCKHNQ